MIYHGYDADGNIIFSTRRPYLDPDDYPDVTIVEGAADRINQYYSSGTLQSKSNMSLSVSKYTIDADGTDLITITNIPNPSKCRILGAETLTNIDITDGILEFSTDTIGTYKISIGSPPYYSEEIEVVAS